MFSAQCLLLRDDSTLKAHFLESGFVDFESQNPVSKGVDGIDTSATLRQHENVGAGRFDVFREEGAGDEVDKFHVQFRVGEGAGAIFEGFLKGAG